MKTSKFYSSVLIAIITISGLNNGNAICQTGLFAAADKMNVLYIGVDNPVSLVVPGYSDDRIKAEINNGSITKTGGGKYNVRVTSGNAAVITVSASGKVIGSAHFRVKSIPSPVPKLAGKPSGNFTKTEILASPFIVADLENFDFDLKYAITSYRFTYKNASGDLIDIAGSGNTLSPSMLNMISSSRRGDRFWIEEIVAAGPSGSKIIGSISIRITS